MTDFSLSLANAASQPRTEACRGLDLLRGRTSLPARLGIIRVDTKVVLADRVLTPCCWSMPYQVAGRRLQVVGRPSVTLSSFSTDAHRPHTLENSEGSSALQQQTFSSPSFLALKARRGRRHEHPGCMDPVLSGVRNRTLANACMIATSFVPALHLTAAN